MVGFHNIMPPKTKLMCQDKPHKKFFDALAEVSLIIMNMYHLDLELKPESYKLLYIYRCSERSF